MDNKLNSPQPENENENWLDDFLDSPKLGEELGPDEHAIHSAGLTHPSEAEIDRIVQETLAEEAQEVPPTSDVEMFKDEEYRDAFGDGDSLNEAFANESEEETAEEESEEEPIRKKRPKSKKGYGLLGIPHILSTVIWLLIVVGIGVTLGRMIWVSAADVLAFGKENQVVTVIIDDDDTIDDVANKLKDAGLIRYPGLFKLYADLAKVEEKGKISPGTYNLNTMYDYMALVSSMNTYSGTRESVDVLIPEGYSCAQIFALLEEKGVCTAAELEAYAANGELDDYWFLEGVERGDKYCLEGYLFPDTYKFYLNDDPERVLEKFLDDFDYRFTDLMIERIGELNSHLAEIMRRRGYSEDEILNNQITIRDIVIVASMIEKESADDSESYKISSVIYNRLYNWDYPPFLNIDAALVYALGGKEILTEADKQLDSPYNTYLYQGLIPGPISNPGLNSLNAALVPEDTDYYFYALDPEVGSHHFSSTQSEHDNFLASLGE